MWNLFSVLNRPFVSQKHILLLCLLLIFSISSQDSQASNSSHSKIVKKETVITDLRILVDISGSMKKTDPNNLRRSAIRLLAGLIPQGSRAGIWNFGKQVNMTVKIGLVDDAWRELARQQSKKINSVGLYTNIESAMRKVSFDWKKADPRYKRNLILLTDGHVDVSQNDSLDKASRKRILKNILPALEQAKVRIHTIALSDDVDESLLSTLSAYTDGLYKKVKSADDLQKLFLQMLEQSVALDTLPIKGNRFNVDANINDMTLLIFNQDSKKPTSIVTPGKRTWKKAKHPEQVKWFSDEGFDLITIKKPQHGQWKIMAPIDENNRVVVATNLKLKLGSIPSYLMLGDILNITAHLEEDGKPLTDQRLLSKFKFVLNRHSERSSERQYPMIKSEKDNFTYEVQLASIFKEGNNELVIQAKSPTAEREVRYQFKVYATPAEIKITESSGKYQIKVTPHTNLLRLDSIKLDLVLNDKSKFKLMQHNANWTIDVDKKYAETYFTLNLNAVRADGQPITSSFDKLLSTQHGSGKLSLVVKKQEHHSAEVEQHGAASQPNNHKKEEIKHKKENSHESDVASSNDDDAKKDNDVNWTVIIYSIVAGNIFLIVLVGGGYVYLKRRKNKLRESLEEELKEDESVELEASEEKNDDNLENKDVTEK